MSIDPVAHHALRNPHSAAFVLASSVVTFAEADRTANALANMLKPEVPAGARVAITVADAFTQWITMLAVGRLGAVSVSVEPARADDLLGAVKPAIVVASGPVAGNFRVARLAPGDLGVLAKDGNTTPVAIRTADDAVVRISLSSGTTGRPKMVAFTHAQMVRRIRSGTLPAQARMGGSVAVRAGVDTALGYAYVMRALWAGASVALFRPSLELLAARNVTGLVASPQQAQQLLRRAPSGARALSGLSVFLGGAKVSPELIMAIRLQLASEVATIYGSTEAGSIAAAPGTAILRDPDMTGFVLPWCDVQAVDDMHRPLPFGETGVLRVRTPEMAEGYLDDPEATARHFKDGWFYPGDTGAVTAAGVLKVAGRSDDLLNVGGLKVAPEALEDALRAVRGVADSAVFAARDKGGEVLCAALVAGADLDRTALRDALMTRLGKTGLATRIMTVPAIPRTALGKVQRHQLRALVTDRAAASV